MKKNFLRILDWGKNEIEEMLSLAKRIKKNPSKYRNALKDRTVALLFEKPSLRTRVSFEVGTYQMAGRCLYISPYEVQLGKREAVKDVARTLSGYVDAVVLRTFKQTVLEEFAEYSGCPVINGLSDKYHPAQILSDLFTMYEYKGRVEDLNVCFVGDGNNVCNSLICAASVFGFSLKIASPKGYFPSLGEIGVKKAKNISFVQKPKHAVRGADVIYTDVWVSMGQEKFKGKKNKFKGFQVDSGLVNLAKKDCIIMHCLPAHRGEEITEEVIESKNSVVFEQAQNRLYAQRALLVKLLGKK